MATTKKPTWFVSFSLRDIDPESPLTSQEIRDAVKDIDLDGVRISGLTVRKEPN